MIESNNKIFKYGTDHTKFGGLIYLSDFDTTSGRKPYKCSPIAERIMSDFAFDKQCRKAAEYRQRRMARNELPNT